MLGLQLMGTPCIPVKSWTLQESQTLSSILRVPRWIVALRGSVPPNKTGIGLGFV